jgi:hypothetical protein
MGLPLTCSSFTDILGTARLATALIGTVAQEQPGDRPQALMSALRLATLFPSSLSP